MLIIHPIRCVALLAVFCAAIPTAAAQSQRESDFDEIVDSLVTRLGSPDFKIREAASRQLKQLPESTLDVLRAHYERVEDHEVKIRIREAVEAILFRAVVGELGGFLGVQPGPPQRMAVPHGNEQVMVVGIERVVPDTAAAAAGLQVGDIVIRLEGVALDIDPHDDTGFSKLISAHAPGTTLEMDVLRKGERLTLQPTLGVRPANLLNPTFVDEHAKAISTIRRRLTAWLENANGS